MSDERPESLLKSALEKIVYFEARSSQLVNDLDQARKEELRLKHELAASSQREIDLRRIIAELEVRTARAHSEREEAARTVDALRRERADLIGNILEASRIHGAGQESSLETLDLAAFISELRSEVVAGRGPASEAGPRRSPPAMARAFPGPVVPSVNDVAQSLQAQGRLTVSPEDFATLERAGLASGRTEETLLGFSVRELAAPDAAARLRAATRLLALGQSAAAPALATALHAEQEPAVIVGFLAALAALAGSEAVAVVQPHLSSPQADVRIAALKALLALDPVQAGPHLAGAMQDPDRAVRRRASLLVLGLQGPAAMHLGTQAISDPDAHVRSLAALVLGASGSTGARGLLMQAMRDREPQVRRSAGEALSRLLGQDVSGLVELGEVQRRREVRRLLHVEARPVQGSVTALDRLRDRLRTPLPEELLRAASPRDAAAPQGAVASASAARTPMPAPLKVPVGVAAGSAQKSVARTAVLEAVAPSSPSATPRVLDAVLGELRAALRGRPLEELAQGASVSVDHARAACAALLEKGLVVRRGLKYFVA